MRAGLIDDDIRIRREIKEILARLGLWELNSFPLGTEKGMGRPNPLIPDVKPARITNPISDDASTLRMSLVAGVIDTFARNLRRGAPIYDVFEIGNVYWQDAQDFHERKEVIIGVLGERSGKKRERTREAGFLRLKGYVEAFMDILGISNYDLVSAPSAPGGTMRHILQRDGETLGIFDAALEDSLGGETFERPVLTASFAWSTIRQAHVDADARKAFRALPSFPAVERDLAFVLDESIAYRMMVQAIRAAGGEYLERVGVFDIYRGRQVGEDKKNLAVNLRFRHPDRTLTDAEVDEWMGAIIELVKDRTGGKLRDW
jgi:phenylalanyl-tRNA synthetase beta chain